LAKNNQVEVERYFGLAHPKTKEEINQRTLFNIGSVTKQFTGYLLLEMIREHRISLDSPVAAYLPEFFNHPIGSIQIRHLMQMTSGIPYLLPLRKFIGIQLSSRIHSETELIQTIIEQKLEFKPGDHFLYSNLGYSLLGIILERVSNQSWSELVQNRIFSPLGITYSQIEGIRPEPPSNLAIGFVPVAIPPLSLFRFIPMPHWNYSMIKGAGGIVSNLHDLYLWNKHLTEKSIRDPAWMKDYFFSGNEKNHFYSYGWEAESRLGLSDSKYQMVFHAGEDPGFFTLVLRIPQLQTFLIVTTNSDYCFWSGWLDPFMEKLKTTMMDIATNAQ